MKRSNPAFPGKLVIGVTGTIAAGKSTLCRYLEKTYGALRIDADLVARDTVEDLRYDLAAVFGSEILDANAHVDRKALGKIVFADPEKLSTLNQMVHPETCRRIFQKIQETEASIALVEAIELLRSDLKDMVDVVVVIYADPELRTKRMMEERGLSQKEAKARIASQLDDVTYRSKADYVILSTEGPFADLYYQCDQVMKEIMDARGIRR